jgi:hypothetical protein
MKFSYTRGLPKITAACSTDKSRPVMCDLHLDAELGELQATDSFIAARIPVELEKGDTSGPIAAKEIVAARKAKAESLKTPKRPKAKKDQPPAYPNLAQLWPTGKEVGTPAFRVGLNASLLAKLAEAIGTRDGQVELLFPGFGKDTGPNPHRPIFVRASHAPDEVREDGPDGSVSAPEGLIMPIRLVGADPAPPAAKANAKTKASSAGSARTASDRSEAARKAAETRRRNAAAAAGNGKQPAAKPKTAKANGRKTRDIAATVRGVAGTKPKQARSGRSAKQQANGDFGKGSDRRRQAALKAAETRRQKLAGNK